PTGRVLDLFERRCGFSRAPHADVPEVDMTTNRFIGRGPRRVLAGVAGGALVLAAGALLIECTGVDEGSASASGQVSGASSAITAGARETPPPPTALPTPHATDTR